MVRRCDGAGNVMVHGSAMTREEEEVEHVGKLGPSPGPEEEKGSGSNGRAGREWQCRDGVQLVVSGWS